MRHLIERMCGRKTSPTHFRPAGKYTRLDQKYGIEGEISYQPGRGLLCDSVF